MRIVSSLAVVLVLAWLLGGVSPGSEPAAPEEKSVPPVMEKAAGDAKQGLPPGSSADELRQTAERIAENAQKAGQRLKERDPGRETRNLQDAILKDIDELIRKAQQPPPPPSGARDPMMPPPSPMDPTMPTPKSDGMAPKDPAMPPEGKSSGSTPPQGMPQGMPQQGPPQGMPDGKGGSGAMPSGMPHGMPQQGSSPHGKPQGMSQQGPPQGMPQAQGGSGVPPGSSDARSSLGSRPRRERRPRDPGARDPVEEAAGSLPLHRPALPTPARLEPKEANEAGTLGAENDRFGRPSPKRDADKLAELYKDVWGQLPDRLRQEMDLYYREEFMPRYSELLRRYYASLAEQRRKGKEGR